MSNWFQRIFQPRTIRRADRRPQLKLEKLEAREAPAIRLLNTFDGLDDSDSGGFTPPDTTLAVGPTRFIEEVNSAIGMFDRAGNRIDVTSLAAFFGQPAGDFVFDPICTYDEYAERFVITALELDNANSKSYLHVAISTDNNPQDLSTQYWTETRAIDMTESTGGNDYWADYPKFGYNQEAYVFTFNMFGFSGGNVHTRILTLDKASWTDNNLGTGASFQVSPTNSYFTMAAAAMHGAPANSPMWFVSRGSGGGSNLTVTKMTNILSANPTFTDYKVAVDPWAAVGDAIQPDGSGVDSLGDRMQNAAWANDRLVATHAVDGNGLPKVAWYEFSTAGATPTKIQEGLINPGGGVSTYVPAIQITTGGNIALTYMQTSQNGEFVSMYITGRQTSMPLGTMSAPIRVFAGQANYGSFRQGDYAGLQIDPVDGTVWAANMYITSDGGWTTGVAQFALTAPPAFVFLGVDPAPGYEGDIFTLSGTFSDPDSPNDPFRLVIDWKDGSAPQTVNLQPGKNTFSVTHKYLDDQNSSAFLIDVSVFDTDNNEGKGTPQALVYNLPPTSAKITNAPTFSTEGKKINLGSLITDPGILDTFGDSAWLVKKDGVDFTSGTGAGFSFTPDDEGVYDVFLTASDDDGGKLDASPVTINVTNIAPTAVQLINDGAKKTGQNVAITFLGVSDADADLSELRFDFDLDGNGTYETLNKTSSQIITTYAVEGIYTVKGRIRDLDGGVSPDYFTEVVISDTAGGHGGFITTRYVVAASDVSIKATVTPPSLVKVYGLDGSEIRTLNPLGNKYTGGYRVATGDVNGDKTEDIIIAPGINGGRTIYVVNGVDGTTLYTVTAPYATNFNKGVFVASGDFNRDGFDDFVISPGVGGVGPVVGYNGLTKAPLFSISPFGVGKSQGSTVAVGDVNGDKKPDLIVGNASVGSQVKVYSYTTSLAATPFWTFNAMPTNYNGGVFVAAGDLNGDRRADIVVGSNKTLNANSLVRVWDGATKLNTRSFTAYSNYKMGVRVGVEDLDGDGKADILYTPAVYSMTVGLTPRVTGVKGDTLAGKFSQSLSETAFRGGVFVG